VSEIKISKSYADPPATLYGWMDDDAGRCTTLSAADHIFSAENAIEQMARPFKKL